MRDRSSRRPPRARPIPLRLISLAWLFFASCSVESGITEVGNPVDDTTTQATAANGTTRALSASVSTFVDGVGSGESSQSALTEMSSEMDSERRGPEGFEECTFNESGTTRQHTCQCQGGGSFTETFVENFTQSGSSFSINNEITVTFTNCVVSSCSGNTTLGGAMTGHITGTVDNESSLFNLTIQQSTSGACSGMTADGEEVGFSMTMTADGTTEDFSGTFCMAGSSVNFDNLRELGDLLDPDQTCSDGFNRTP